MELIGIASIIFILLSFVISNKVARYTVRLLFSLSALVYSIYCKSAIFIVLFSILTLFEIIRLHSVVSVDTDDLEIKSSIIIGFPGIGKTTIAKNRSRYIDLDSSNFVKDDPDWYISYCNCAFDLASEGYCVFISAHEKVQDYISRKVRNFSDISLCACFPAIHLRYHWIQRLRDRYLDSGEYRDMKAYERVQKYYESDVHRLMNLDAVHVEITSMEYDLDSEIVNAYLRTYCKY